MYFLLYVLKKIKPTDFLKSAYRALACVRCLIHVARMCVNGRQSCLNRLLWKLELGDLVRGPNCTTL
jgi:hypothetical protein